VKDGLWQALEMLKEDFKIVKKNVAKDYLGLGRDFKFVLVWGAWGSPQDKFGRTFDCKKGICIAGNVVKPIKPNDYDVLFYETKWYQPEIKFHKRIVHAFGMNRREFKNLHMDRDIDYLGVGAFALWKRWDEFSKLSGYRVVVGEVQVDNMEESMSIWNRLTENGVHCQTMVTTRKLSVLYNRAKTVFIPADINGGGERAILEARACGCDIQIMPDNPKLLELLDCPMYDENYYYRKLKEGITACVS